MVAPAGYNLNPNTYDVFQLASLYLRTAGLPDTPTNRRLLAGWFWAESAHSGQTGVVAYNNNPLNITTSGSNFHTFANNSLHFANYATPQEGAQAWTNLVNSNPGYRGIVTALRVQDTPQAFSSAIGHSPWGTSSSGVLSAVYYMQHFTADLSGTPLLNGTPYSPNYSVTFGNASNTAQPIVETFATGTTITQDFISGLAQDLLNKGAFGGTTAQGDFNPVDNAVAGTAKGVFIAAMQPLIGMKWGPSVNAPLGGYITQAAQNQPKAPSGPDLTTINSFITNLNSNNFLHIGAIAAGAVMVFFGLRILLAQAGVSTSGGQQGGTNTTVVRQYPVIMR
jgi:hypothetical protein